MNHSFRIATYNLRYANNKDLGNLWVDRAPVVINLIRFHAFDILATQEGLKWSLDEISHALPYYERFGAGRDDGKEAGEHCAIFFHTNKFEMLNGGTFWLSPSPAQPGFGWDARHNRICTWVKLRVKTGLETFFVFNVHFDHYGLEAREASSNLVLNKTSEIAGDQPCILTGDFNSDQQTTCYKTIVESELFTDVAGIVEHPYINNPSFNSWGKESPENRMIDHIFTTKHFRAEKYGVLTDTYFSKTPSDHFPVMADLVLPELTGR